VRPVKILGTGWCASAGALIYSAAKKENRYCCPTPATCCMNRAAAWAARRHDVEIQAREIIRMRERLNKIFAAATGQTLEQIKKDTDRDYWMSAQEAMDCTVSSARFVAAGIVRHDAWQERARELARSGAGSCGIGLFTSLLRLACLGRADLQSEQFIAIELLSQPPEEIVIPEAGVSPPRATDLLPRRRRS
jgi:hypothetical protein